MIEKQPTSGHVARNGRASASSAKADELARLIAKQRLEDKATRIAPKISAGLKQSETAQDTRGRARTRPPPSGFADVEIVGPVRDPETGQLVPDPSGVRRTLKVPATRKRRAA